MHTAYSARWQQETCTVACSTQTHLWVAKLEWLESCNKWKTFKHVFGLFQLVLSPSWPMCHLRDSRASLWIQQQFCGEREGGSRIFWAFITCWELQMKASLRYPTLSYLSKMMHPLKCYQFLMWTLNVLQHFASSRTTWTCVVLLFGGTIPGCHVR